MMTNITVYTQSKSLRHFLYAAAQNELSIMCNVLCEPSLHFHHAIMLDYRCIKQSTSVYVDREKGIYCEQNVQELTRDNPFFVNTNYALLTVMCS